MAGITRHPQSKFWTAIYYDSEGTKFRKSTKCTDAREAKRIAERWEELAKAGSQRKLTEARVRNVCADILEHYNGEKIQFHTCREWFAEWLAGKTGTVATRTLDRYKQITDEFLKHLGPRADITVRAVTVADVRSFRDVLAKKKKMSATTVNQNIAKILATPFVAALKLGYCDINPVSAVPPLAEEKVERDVFSPAQIAQLLAVAKGDWKGCIVAGYVTGLRLRDIAWMKWNAFNFETGTIEVVAMKTGRKVTLPLHPMLAEWLKDRRRGIGKAPVFPDLSGKGTGGKTGLSGQFAGIMATAGITGRELRGTKSKGRQTSSLSFHSLRHSFNSHLAAAGVPREIRKALVGHLDDKSHDAYTHHGAEVLKDAVSRLPKIG